MDTIEQFISMIEKKAQIARHHGPRDWSHDHGYARGKTAAFVQAVKLLRKMTAY